MASAVGTATAVIAVPVVEDTLADTTFAQGFSSTKAKCGYAILSTRNVCSLRSHTPWWVAACIMVVQRMSVYLNFPSLHMLLSS